MRKDKPKKIKYPKIRVVKVDRKHLSKQLDDLWRQYIYKRAGNKCEYCGKEGSLNAHHIFSRSNRPIRWDTDNGICLCPYHHTLGTISFHKAPAMMLGWLQTIRGSVWYERLLLKAGTSTKFSLDDLKMLVMYYKAKIKELENADRLS
jgi:hypothetical protein